MNSIWSRIRRLLSIKPKGYCREMRLKEHLLDSIDWHHDNIIYRAKRLISIFSQGKHDGDTLVKAHAHLEDISHSRFRVGLHLRALSNLKYKDLLISQDELDDDIECDKLTERIARSFTKMYLAAQAKREAALISEWVLVESLEET